MHIFGFMGQLLLLIVGGSGFGNPRLAGVVIFHDMIE